jgi:hypothetical protein
MKAKQSVERVVAVILLFVASGLLVRFFEGLPIEGTSLGIDWRGLWSGIQGGTLRYGTGLCNPPWSILPVLPLGFLSFRASWGLLTLATLGTLVASVPRTSSHKIRWLSVLLLITSYPALRHVADGNLEGLVIAGLLLVLYGYHAGSPWALAAGTLLATAKMQETWLLMVALAIYVIGTWSPRRWAASALVVAIGVVPGMLWLGRDWLNAVIATPQRGSIMDSSLSAAVSRLGLPSWVFGSLWVAVLAATLYIVLAGQRSISRQKAGFLISASLLLSPYAAGNSFLTVLAIGIIPVAQSRPLIGMMLIALTNLPYFTLASPDVWFWWSATYWTALLLLTWIVFAWQLYRLESRRYRSNTWDRDAQPAE